MNLFETFPHVLNIFTKPYESPDITTPDGYELDLTETLKRRHTKENSDDFKL